ncbi:MAG: hypothetical protein LBK82_07370 [Planctomycetaceae bacterium]|nr:hypothetical protein [Planctomycetaceae bacterium]
MTPKRKATPFAIVNPVHSRLTPTRCFGKTSPTSFGQNIAHLVWAKHAHLLSFTLKGWQLFIRNNQRFCRNRLYGNRRPDNNLL